MILIGYSIGKTLIAVLMVTLALLVLYIAYKKLLAYLGKGVPVQKDYCVLYGLEVQPSRGEVEFYFTTESLREVSIELLDSDMTVNQVITKGEFEAGGHIIRFNSADVKDGDYYYCLRTENQKTMKKMVIRNV
ncbi:MAG: hypothetical protein ACK46O_03210 [Flavobacteriia bacterium]|jgi:hypothetical protein